MVVGRDTWLAGLFAVFMVWLLLGQADAWVVARFAGFCVLGITLPGVVLLRLATPRSRSVLEDVAAGFLVGASCLLLGYLALAAAGWQRWAPLWGVPVVLAGVLARRRVLRRAENPLTTAQVWLTAIACALPMYKLGRHHGGPAPYTDPYSNSPDLAFQHALAASAKYDFPPRASWVHGEPMAYHYFFHEFIAAVSWGTGIELADLVYAIGWMPILLAGTALLVPLADRLAPGSAWAGPLAIGVCTLGGTVQPYVTTSLAAEQTTGYVLASPTQNLGGALAVLLALLAVDLLRGDRSRWTWLLFVLVATAGAGSKATVLPAVICGFGLAALVRLIARRLPVAALAGVTIGGLLFYLVVRVVFGGESSGLALRPGRLFSRVTPYRYLSFDDRALWITGVVTVLAWTLGAAGLLVAIVPTRRWVRDPAVPFLVGMAAGGLAGTLLTDQSSGSQLYFHRTVMPVIAVLASYGIWLVSSRLPDRRRALLPALAVAAGLGAAALARAILRPGTPFRAPDGRLVGVVGPWVWTVGMLLAAAVLVTVVWKLARRPGSWWVTVATAFLCACTAAGLLSSLQSLLPADRSGLRPAGTRPAGTRPVGPTRTQSEAAVWLREHSRPGDLVATNAHCVIHIGRLCDNRHFWIAALTERHVLIEGWGYTNRLNKSVEASGDNTYRLPFWDPGRLAANDAAFTAGTGLRAAVGRLKGSYGVRWLYADPTYAPIPPELAEVAELRYDGPDARVYELR